MLNALGSTAISPIIMNAPSTNSPFAATRFPSAVRLFANRLKRRWKSLKIGNRDDEIGVPLEPLAFWPERPSTMLANAPGDIGAVEGYAFHTRYVGSTGGRISFRVVLNDLSGSKGYLLVSINGLDHNGQPLRPILRKFSVGELLKANGRIELSTTALAEHTYAVMGTLVDSDVLARDITITVKGADTDDAYLARVEAAKRGFLSAPGEGVLADIIVQRPPSLEFPISQMCTASQLSEKQYWKICRLMKEKPTSHRKQWEFVYIIRSLAHHGAWRAGARGLGFGVGEEPLSSIFAHAGCTIVATDLHADDHRADVWNNTNQLGADLQKIYHPRLCDGDRFLRNVSFRPVDMNAIPEDLTDFDFTWSSCAYEHLGSIEAGLTFFEKSLECLAPGGLAVHTTEINLTSNDNTLDEGNTVLFRRRDFEELARRLIAQGHEVMPITFDSGDKDLDRVIDLPPYANDPHLKLALMRWVSTSFGLTVRKRR